MGTAMNRTSTERKRDNQCDNRLTAAMIKLNEHNTQGYSSAGRATVSKSDTIVRQNNHLGQISYQDITRTGSERDNAPFRALGVSS